MFTFFGFFLIIILETVLYYIQYRTEGGGGVEKDRNILLTFVSIMMRYSRIKVDKLIRLRLESSKREFHTFQVGTNEIHISLALGSVADEVKKCQELIRYLQKKR